jgi:hypothetical protein
LIRRIINPDIDGSSLQLLVRLYSTLLLYPPTPLPPPPPTPSFLVGGDQGR